MTTRKHGNEDEQPKVVIRDRRRIDPVTGVPRHVTTTSVGADSAGAPAPAEAAAEETAAPADVTPATDGPTTGTPPTGADPAELAAVKAELDEVQSELTDARKALANLVASSVGGSKGDAAKAQADLAERTADLKRVTAEYANYRKRVDRDRTVVIEQATGAVLTSLLPVLDDLDRARAHGDLTGAFGAVSDQLVAILTKLGLAPFGESGDAFDPTWHEAVMHTTNGEVTEPTCVEVLRKGYALGERLLRPAMVAVADPDPDTEPGETSTGDTSTDA